MFLLFLSRPSTLSYLLVVFLLPFFLLIAIPCHFPHTPQLPSTLGLIFFLVDPPSSNSPRGQKLLFKGRDFALLALIFAIYFI